MLKLDNPANHDVTVKEYLPDIREALDRVPNGAWREFAAFAGPELASLTNWDSKVVLVGDSSHALSGAFGSGAGFAMEDGWVLAQALKLFRNDLKKAFSLFNEIRIPYYSRMYAHLESEAQHRASILEQLVNPTDEDRVRIKVIKSGGKDMSWIYGNNISKVWMDSTSKVSEQSEMYSAIVETMIKTPA